MASNENVKQIGARFDGSKALLNKTITESDENGREVTISDGFSSETDNKEQSAFSNHSALGENGEGKEPSCPSDSNDDVSDAAESNDDKLTEESDNEGFSLLNNDTWGEMYQRLLDYQKKNGHCRVPYRYKKDPKLGTWVSVQRRHYKLLKSGRRKKTSLTPDRESKLEKIGFQWSCEVPWGTYFQQLLEFVAVNGHAQVPMKWEKDPKFSNWVSSQRREYKNLQMGRTSSLNTDQIELLNNIGFVWQAERGGAKRIREGSHVQAPDNMSWTSPMLKNNALKMLNAVRKFGVGAVTQGLHSDSSASAAVAATTKEDNSCSLNLGNSNDQQQASLSRALSTSLNTLNTAGAPDQSGASAFQHASSMLSGLNPLTQALLNAEQTSDTQQHAVTQATAVSRQLHVPLAGVPSPSMINSLPAHAQRSNIQAQTNRILEGVPASFASFLGQHNAIDLARVASHRHAAHQIAAPAAAAEAGLMFQSSALQGALRDIAQQNNALAMLRRHQSSGTMHAAQACDILSPAALGTSNLLQQLPANIQRDFLARSTQAGQLLQQDSSNNNTATRELEARKRQKTMEDLLNKFK